MYVFIRLCIYTHLHIYMFMHIHTHSGILLSCKNEIVDNASKWVKLENIILNEVT